MNNSKKDWLFVPPKGTYVVADHPITEANPHLIFCVVEVKSDFGRIAVRGNHTMWFSVKLLREPTIEEAQNLSNYASDEL